MQLFLYIFRKDLLFLHPMKQLTINIYKHSKDLPEMEYLNYFHSKKLFQSYEKSVGYTPYMVCIETSNNEILCHMLGVVRRRGSWIPPYLYTQCRIYGEGDYKEQLNENKEELFHLMLGKLTRTLSLWCLYIEVSNISGKMFGYKSLRHLGYFPVHWLEVHNSLHSMDPEDRLTDKKIRKHINTANESGVSTTIIDNEKDLAQFYKMTHSFYKAKLRRFCPPISFFSELLKDKENAHLFVSKYKNKVIGGSAVVFSEGNAYLWYAAYKPKSYYNQHPNSITIWNALKYCYEHNYGHLYFMDVGLPFKKNHVRDYILSFGGKLIGTNRWFRCSIGWINNILSWIWRD